jgi:exosortase F-associated protein
VKNEWLDFWRSPQRIAFLLLAIIGLGLVFLFQEVDVLGYVFQVQLDPNIHFIVKKTLRVFLNDSCMLLFIHAWFFQRSITQMAWKLQLIDTCILLPVYFILKLSVEGDSEISSPLLSQLHRLIVNPTLMILLIPAIYFQRIRKQTQD